MRRLFISIVLFQAQQCKIYETELDYLEKLKTKADEVCESLYCPLTTIILTVARLTERCRK